MRWAVQDSNLRPPATPFPVVPRPLTTPSSVKQRPPRADLACMSLVIALVILGSASWVGYDASQRDWSRSSFANRPWKWVLGTVLLWIVVFPLYLIQRGKVSVKPPA